MNYSPDISLGNILTIAAIMAWGLATRWTLWRVGKTLQQTNHLVTNLIGAIIGLSGIAGEMRDDNREFSKHFRSIATASLPQKRRKAGK